MFPCHIGDFDRWVECDATVIDHLQNRWNQIGKPNITLSVYIKRLRDKLEMPGHPLISTVRGMGYRLEVDGHDKK